MSNFNAKRSWFALVISHMGGMIDLAALPVWVGTIIAAYAFMPAEGGLIVTLFLVGAVISSFGLAPIAFCIRAAIFAALRSAASPLVWLRWSVLTRHQRS